MRRRGPRTERGDDQATHLAVAVLLVIAIGFLWSAGPRSGFFAPTGAMAALMGVFLAVALKSSAN